MKNAFSGRALPLFIQSPLTWLKLILLSAAVVLSFGMWGCPLFLRFHAEMTGWAVFFTLLSNGFHLAILPRLRPALFAEDRWTITKELFFNSWVIVSCLLLVSAAGLLQNGRFQVTETWFHTVIPAAWTLTVCVTVIHQAIGYLQNHRRARYIKTGIRKRTRLTVEKHLDDSIPVRIHEKETQIHINDIAYIHSDRGQTTVAVSDLTGIREGRSPMEFKSVREHFRKVSNFYRCHRDWMVNMDKVTGIRADALGFLLEMEPDNRLIPVSSSLNGDMEGRLMK